MNRKLPVRPDQFDAETKASRSPSPWLMAALLAFIAALALPKNNPFPYDFEQGERWKYADLRAPFDYEVMRPEAEMTVELAKLEAESAPYFLMDAEIARQQKRVFQKEFEAQIQKSRNDEGYAELVANQNTYLNFSLNLLDGLFHQGILAVDTPPSGHRPGQPVFLMKNGTETRVPFSSMLTMRDAREWLTDTLPFSKLANPEILLPIFENALVPNVRFNDSLTVATAKRKRESLLKTGISVQKNEMIVGKNAPVTQVVFQKLTSLGNRFDVPNANFQLLGYLGLAGLAATALALLVLVWFPEKWDDRKQPMLIFGAVLLIIVVFGAFARLGPSVALLTPMLFLLFFLHQFFQKDLVWMAYLLAVLLTGLALEWGFGWCVIQFAGGFTLLLFPRRVISWRGRLIVTATATGVMTAALLGVILAGKFARSALTWETPVYLWMSALLSLAAFPMANFFRKKLGRTSDLAEIESGLSA